MRSKTTAAAIVLLLLPFFPAHVSAQKMKVGYWTSGFSLGFGAVMEQMRFAENQGLSIDWVKFAEVNGPTRAIVSNAIDVAFAAPSTNSMGIAADGVPVKIVLATQIAEAQIVVLEGSPIKSVTDLKGKKIGMSPAGSATHAIATAILNNNFGLKPTDYAVAPETKRSWRNSSARKKSTLACCARSRWHKLTRSSRVVWRVWSTNGKN